MMTEGFRRAGIRLVVVVLFIACPPMVIDYLLSGRHSPDATPAEGRDFSSRTVPQTGRRPGEYPIYFRWEGHGGWLTAPFFIDLVATERGAAGEECHSYVLLEKVYVPKFEQDSLWSGTFTLKLTCAQKATIDAKRYHALAPCFVRFADITPVVE
jgi:hypothetical protein